MAESRRDFSWPWKGKKESTKTNRSQPGITISAPILRQDIPIPSPPGVKGQGITISAPILGQDKPIPLPRKANPPPDVKAQGITISAPILRQDKPIPLPRKAKPPPLNPSDVSDIPTDEDEEDWEEYWGIEDDDDDDVSGSPELDPMSFDSQQSVFSNVFKSNKVVPLTSTDFRQFINGMEKAMVMFYSPLQGRSVAPGLELGVAADSTYHTNHGFAAVDCSVCFELCCEEQVGTLPIFKLYSNGYELSTLRELKAVKARQLNMLMAMTPILTQPRQKSRK